MEIYVGGFFVFFVPSYTDLAKDLTPTRKSYEQKKIVDLYHMFLFRSWSADTCAKMPTEFEEFGMAHFFMLRDRKKKFFKKKSRSEVQNLYAPLSIINIFVSLKNA